MNVPVHVEGDVLVVGEQPHAELAGVPLPPDEEAAGVVRERGVEAGARPLRVHCVHPASPLFNWDLNTQRPVPEVS